MNVAILDDHLLVSQALDFQIRSLFEHAQVSVFNNIVEFNILRREVSFDVLLLDIDLGTESGLDLLKKLRSEAFPGKIVMISGNISSYTLQEALQSGANGFVGKDASAVELKEAFTTVLDGGTYLSKSLSGLATKMIGQPSKFGLSDREIEVIQLIVQGLGYKEIGERLFISPRTVEAHRNHILEKLQLKNVMELVRFALKHHLV